MQQMKKVGCSRQVRRFLLLLCQVLSLSQGTDLSLNFTSIIYYEALCYLTLECFDLQAVVRHGGEAAC